MAEIAASACARLQGHSVVVCRCKQADRWLPCPMDALGKLTPTYPPAAYAQAAEQMRREKESAILQAVVAKAAPAYSGGYTGSICDVCGSTRMRRSGTCETCEDCGNAGGCG